MKVLLSKKVAKRLETKKSRLKVLVKCFFSPVDGTKTRILKIKGNVYMNEDLDTQELTLLTS